MDGLSKSKVGPCGFCFLAVKANSVLCVQCGKWIHGRCDEVKGVTAMFYRNFACRKYEGNTSEAMERKKML